MKQLRLWPHGHRCTCGECFLEQIRRVALWLRRRDCLTEPTPRGLDGPHS